MKKIRTILGDIEREKLGFTYTHEHLIAVPPVHQKDRDLELNDYYNILFAYFSVLRLFSPY